MAATFDGFPKAATKFLKELEKNNNKAWFDDNRADYEQGLLEPCNSFVAAMGPKLAKISPDIHAELKINSSLMRINRDTRLSKD
jgi:uncharacterized protein (TIGR02453 family)